MKWSIFLPVLLLWVDWLDATHLATDSRPELTPAVVYRKWKKEKIFTNSFFMLGEQRNKEKVWAYMFTHKKNQFVWSVHSYDLTYSKICRHIQCLYFNTQKLTITLSERVSLKDEGRIWHKANSDIDRYSKFLHEDSVYGNIENMKFHFYFHF